MPAKDTEKNTDLDATESPSAAASPEPGAETAPGSAEMTEELSPEEMARQLLQEHQQAYRQRIEDAKAKIRMRAEWRRVRRLGQTYTYTVQAGDTLETIAKAFYAKPERWHEIYEANAEAIPGPAESHPQALEPGTELIIP
jgi:nucleoid-associated protein YgaU